MVDFSALEGAGPPLSELVKLADASAALTGAGADFGTGAGADAVFDFRATGGVLAAGAFELGASAGKLGGRLGGAERRTLAYDGACGDELINVA